MREIKFRAWDKKRKVMIHDQDQKVMEIYPELKCGAYIPNTIRRIGEFFGTYMQYTGLKDKNGVEIYESDILLFKFERPGFEEDIVREVYYGYSSFLVKDSNDYDERLDSIYYQRCPEVIGNIYENPELLEEK